MKKSVISALAIAALAGTAVAQPVRLELRIVPQNGTPATVGNPASPVTDQADTVHDLVTTIGSVRRFEVQYRIVDLDTADAIFPAGLTAAQMNITAVLNGAAGSVSRALLSNFEAQQAAATPPAATDPGAAATGANANAQGMHRPFRGGISGPTPPNNDNAANGALTALQIAGVTPLSLAQNDQNADGGWYGLYSFNFTASGGAGTVALTAELVPDPNSGNRFGYFNDGFPVPLNSPNATSGTASVPVNIPAPGSLALLGLGGLIATRRRRA